MSWKSATSAIRGIPIGLLHIEANHRPFVPAVYPWPIRPENLLLWRGSIADSPIAPLPTLELPTGLAAGIHTWPLLSRKVTYARLDLGHDHTDVARIVTSNDSLDKAQSVSFPVTFTANSNRRMTSTTFLFLPERVRNTTSKSSRHAVAPWSMPTSAFSMPGERHCKLVTTSGSASETIPTR